MKQLTLDIRAGGMSSVEAGWLYEVLCWRGVGCRGVDIRGVACRGVGSRSASG